MRDINFFSPYIENKKVSNKKYFYISIITFGVIFIIGGAILFTHLLIKDLEAQISEMKGFLGSESANEKLQEINNKKSRLGILNEYYKLAEEIDEKINSVDVLDSSIIEAISTSLPKDAYINVMSMTQETVQIQGFSDSRVSVAELQHNLRITDMFEDVHLASIIESNSIRGNYQFVMKCMIKGAYNYEAD